MTIHSLPTSTIVSGDSLPALRLLPECCIHLVVTSPPYDKLRSYQGFTFDFESTAKELYRVLAPGGVLCWVVGDSVVNGSETLTSAKQKIFFAEQCGFAVHDTMIYEKLNFSAPEKVRYHQTFEYVFVLSKGKPRAFHPLMDRPNLWAGHSGTLGQLTKRGSDGKQKKINDAAASKEIKEFGMRTNVWRGKTAGQEYVCQPLAHPARMPEWLAGDLILSWSNLGDMVLDPFAGEGTTGLMAQRHGRFSMLMELSEEYCSLILARLAKG